MKKLGFKFAACVTAVALLVAALPYMAFAEDEVISVFEVYVNAESEVVIGEKPVVSAEDEELFLSMDEFYEQQGYQAFSFSSKDGDYIDDTSELVAGEQYDMTVMLCLRDTDHYQMNYQGTATTYQAVLEHQEDYYVTVYVNGEAIHHATDYNPEFGEANFVIFPDAELDFDLDPVDGPVIGHNAVQICIPVTAVAPANEEPVTPPQEFEPGKSTGAKTGDDFVWFW